MTLLRRIVVEKRAILVPIALVLVANVVAFAFVVYPLQQRVSSTETRRADAERDRGAAVRELAEARAAQESQQRAEGDLQTFYRQVLPTSLAEARKAVYVRLAQIAREHNLRYERQSVEEDQDADDSSLRRLRLTVVLDGTYPDVRRFLHAVETAPEFLIVDTMGLAFRTDDPSPLVVTLSLSTYFRANGHVS